jgi:hypothetical protein
VSSLDTVAAIAGSIVGSSNQPSSPPLSRVSSSSDASAASRAKSVVESRATRARLSARDFAAAESAAVTAGRKTAYSIRALASRR